ncbi:MAG TPA: VOC family protein [Candidatus Saccharimonadales bacterium]|nr:VOC family protein [Candidatus Saccharimonadales bacterium]
MKVSNTTLIIATANNDKAMGTFYSKKLGFKKNKNGGWENANISVYFDRHNKAAKKAIEPFRVMLTLAVDDIEKAYKELKKKGVKFVRTPAKEEWGGWFATFKDPDGNYLQIFQYKP